jgi:hypothetical protein
MLEPPPLRPRNGGDPAVQQNAAGIVLDGLNTATSAIALRRRRQIRERFQYCQARLFGLVMLRYRIGGEKIECARPKAMRW